MSATASGRSEPCAEISALLRSAPTQPPARRAEQALGRPVDAGHHALDQTRRVSAEQSTRSRIGRAHWGRQRDGALSDAQAAVRFLHSITPAAVAMPTSRTDPMNTHFTEHCDDDKSEAAAKTARDLAEDRDQAQETAMKADYKVAGEKCNALNGDAKDRRQAAARARYGQ
jgi:hypothetical protein